MHEKKLYFKDYFLVCAINVVTVFACGARTCSSNRDQKRAHLELEQMVVSHPEGAGKRTRSLQEWSELLTNEASLSNPSSTRNDFL